ncbi:MAG: NfeD family protein [Candidatus Omnitrophica bacterium]|nr:NfeD family protein [Candidatus Omnitrophota bacterium]
MGKKDRFFLTTMIGATGRTVSVLDPEGTVRIMGELWKAIAANAPINPGEEVIVIDQKGLMLTVARCNGADTRAHLNK